MWFRKLSELGDTRFVSQKGPRSGTSSTMSRMTRTSQQHRVAEKPPEKCWLCKQLTRIQAFKPLRNTFLVQVSVPVLWLYTLWLIIKRYRNWLQICEQLWSRAQHQCENRCRAQVICSKSIRYSWVSMTFRSSIFFGSITWTFESVAWQQMEFAVVRYLRCDTFCVFKSLKI